MTELEFTLGPLHLIPPGEGRICEVAGERVAIFHTRAGEVFATQANCPHKSGPLADGLLGGQSVICPLHTWKFNLSTGEQVAGSCRLITYPVRVTTDGKIVLTMPVPDISEVIS